MRSQYAITISDQNDNDNTSRARAPQSYIATSRRANNKWPVHKISPVPFQVHANAQPTLKVERPALDDVLSALRSPDFVEGLSTLREGREDLLFEQLNPVNSLVSAIQMDETSRDKIERFLDIQFEDLRKGELFEHTYVVCALLYALKKAGIVYFYEIASIFVNARSSELAYLQRFATRLLKTV